MANPYSNLPGTAYWKTAVAEPDPLEIAELSRPSRPITKADSVATGGSCFAQHISRRLRANAFNFLDVEPAPDLLLPERRARFGYDLYSARYGNIYTSSQLRQLLERALGRFEPAEAVWENDGRYFDPFRPSVEPGGFDSADEVIDHQRSHLHAVKRMFREADVFVFTLGLTETWRSTEDGAVYPMCPGTQAGTFDPSRHEFVNLTFDEVMRDMRFVVRKLTRTNPELRFVLTVSPVPLTATASGEHVLVATTYSKSVLRAVAGQLAQEHENVDYFPSYEIVTAPVFGGAFFSQNRRTVLPEGVDFVMQTFFREFCDASEAPPKRRRKPSRDDVAAAREARRARAEAEDDEQDLVCDEQVLEFYAT